MTAGASEVKLEKKAESAGIEAVNYSAQLPGTYEIDVMYDGKHVSNSPYSAILTGPEISLDPLQCSERKVIPLTKIEKSPGKGKSISFTLPLFCIHLLFNIFLFNSLNMFLCHIV